MNFNLRMLISFNLLLFASGYDSWTTYDMRTSYEHYIKYFEEKICKMECKMKTSCLCKVTTKGFFYQCDALLNAIYEYHELNINCNKTVGREDVRDHIIHLSEEVAGNSIALLLHDCPLDSILDFRYPAEISHLSVKCIERKNFILNPHQFQNLSKLDSLRISCVFLRTLPKDLFKSTKLKLSRFFLEETMIERLENGFFSNFPALESVAFMNNKKLSTGKIHFTGLHNLRELYIHNSPSKEIDEDLFVPIYNISQLTISGIGWKSLPKSFTLLQKLESLQIVDTSIEGVIHDSCSRQIGIEYIDITGNPHLDIHPDCLSKFNTSKQIDLSRNRISSLPNTAIQMNSLYAFKLNDNGCDITMVNNFIHSKSVIYIGMRNSFIKSIHKDFFRSIPYIKEVDLSYNQLTYLPNGFFEVNEILEKVSLRGNLLTSIPESLFDLKIHMTWIDVSHNNISKIDHIVGQNLSSLKHLDLSYNKLSRIPRDPFSSMPELTYFDISNNKISQIDTDAIQPMSNLKEFYLRNNLLKGKFFLTFQNFDFLTRIGAGSNFFTDISWLNMSSLKDLDLSNNLIENLDLRVFESCANLNHLNLSGNRIEELPREVFSMHLKNLASLDLSFNKMKSLPRYIDPEEEDYLYKENENFQNKLKHGFYKTTLFYGLKLEFLNISGNPMESVELSLLGTDMDCRKVSIRNCNISKLISKELVGHVLVLDLSHNRINSKCWPWFLDERQKLAGKISPFVELIDLEELYLAHNEITDIALDFRLRNPNLRILDLRYNRIKHLSYHELLFSSYIVDRHGNAEPYYPCHNLTVDLRNNLIGSIHIPHAMLVRNITTKCGKHKYSHATILLGNNPFECGCNVIPFLRVVEEDVVLTSELWRTKGIDWVKQARIDATNLTCRYPETVNGKLVVATETWMHHLLPLMGFCYLSEDTDIYETK